MSTQAQIFAKAEAAADRWWLLLRKFYPSIAATRPKIVYNRRLKTTAGRAFIANNPQYIDLSVELLLEHPEFFFCDTIGHELAHCVAYTVYGDPGHGKGWKTVMRTIGLAGDRCHSMINSLHETKKLVRMTQQ